MKARISLKFLVFVLALTCLTAVGCRKKPVGVTPLPGARAGYPGEVAPGGIMPGDRSAQGLSGETTPVAYPAGPGHPGWAEDRDMFKSETVYFDYDSSAIKSGEKSKIEKVAEYLKGNSALALKVEGNCDERGTEEYNRSLGERRALAIREYLINSGLAPERVDTISYGEDKPVAFGHDESAWKQNRRGDFVVLTAPR